MRSKYFNYDNIYFFTKFYLKTCCPSLPLDVVLLCMWHSLNKNTVKFVCFLRFYLPQNSPSRYQFWGVTRPIARVFSFLVWKDPKLNFGDKSHFPVQKVETIWRLELKMIWRPTQLCSCSVALTAYPNPRYFVTTRPFRLTFRKREKKFRNKFFELRSQVDVKSSSAT